jgi:tetratricopeptide (TPR) repeat protein
MIMIGLFKESSTKMDRIKKGLLALMVAFTPLLAGAQCGTFDESPRGEDGKDAVSVYRQAMKMEDYTLAFDQWKVAYEIAPAADGERYSIFLDGAQLYIRKFKEATDPEDQKAYATKALGLYDQCIACYESGNLRVKNCQEDKCIQEQIGIIYGRKAYDMYYSLSSPRAETLKALQKSLELAGNKAEYIIVSPLAAVLTSQFEKGKVEVPIARQLVIGLTEMVDYNIEHSSTYKAYFQQGKDYMEAQFATIEGDLFDYNYFNIKRMIARLKAQSTPADDPFLVELESRWSAYAEQENARIQADLETKYPNLAARRLFDEGKYQEAIDKYLEAIELAESNEDKATYWFSIASIEFRKLDRYSSARESAYKAAKLKGGWGRPYMLIGDMYATTARNCGDPWGQSLAILAAIEKYRYAKSIDSEVAGEATSRINNYAASKPAQEQGFMQGIKPGEKAKVNCWIGEIVTVEYRN